jgi:hypothetical protein
MRNRGHNEEREIATRQGHTSTAVPYFKKELLREKARLPHAPSVEIESLQYCLFSALSGKEDQSRSLSIQTQFIPQSPPHHVPPPFVAPGVGALSLCVPVPYSASGRSDRSSDCSQTPDISFL